MKFVIMAFKQVQVKNYFNFVVNFLANLEAQKSNNINLKNLFTEPNQISDDSETNEETIFYRPIIYRSFP